MGVASAWFSRSAACDMIIGFSTFPGIQHRVRHTKKCDDAVLAAAKVRLTP